MEVRNIVKEVVSLVYEWEDEDDDNENNKESNEKELREPTYEYLHSL